MLRLSGRPLVVTVLRDAMDQCGVSYDDFDESVSSSVATMDFMINKAFKNA